MADHGRYCRPRFAQLDDDYKVWAAYQRAQLKKEKLRAAVVTDRPASSSDDKKSDPVVDEWDAMNEAAQATIQMSVKLVHLNTVTSWTRPKRRGTRSRSCSRRETTRSCCGSWTS